MWQHIKLPEQIRPWGTLACCRDAKQPTNKQYPSVYQHQNIECTVMINLTFKSFSQFTNIKSLNPQFWSVSLLDLSLNLPTQKYWVHISDQSDFQISFSIYQQKTTIMQCEMLNPGATQTKNSSCNNALMEPKQCSLCVCGKILFFVLGLFVFLCVSCRFLSLHLIANIACVNQSLKFICFFFKLTHTLQKVRSLCDTLCMRSINVCWSTSKETLNKASKINCNRSSTYLSH